MKLQSMILFVALVTIIGPAAGRVYTSCQLATLAINNGITTNISDWVCLIMSESSGNTAAQGGSGSDGSYYYGLFQINWKCCCGLNGPGGICNIPCSSLLDDDVTDDFACAKLIYELEGFSAWYGWLAKCQPPPDVTPC